jgi:hypothetical protein
MASGERVDWNAARQSASSEDLQARIDALQGIEQIAAFSPRAMGTLRAAARAGLGMKTADLEAWLAGLDTRDAADLRRALSARTGTGDHATECIAVVRRAARRSLSSGHTPSKRRSVRAAWAPSGWHGAATAGSKPASP